MTWPSYLPVPQKRPVSGGDIAASVTALVVALLIGAVAAVLGLFSVAFLDYCPPPRCSTEGAVSAVFTAVIAAAGIFVVGLVATIVALVCRRRGWPYAVGTLVLVVIALFCGGVGYSMAVG